MQKTTGTSSGNSFRFILFAIFASFGAYFCMYAFRKPFSVAAFAGQSWAGVDYKIWLIVFQVLGYTSSKFLGIKYIAELHRHWRPYLLAALILFAELALLLFAFVPPPYNIVLLFLNGLPLGMVWGGSIFLSGRAP
ncbi:MAG: hypothetical protein HC913_07540 [Microscillaceae bacterium]|nr:hypothetical protein [Microscillaceae bacterium]